MNPVHFEVGKEYDRLAITRTFGYSDDKQSMRGGLFLRNDTIILIKDENGQQYEDRWDPYRPGSLVYYATLKNIRKNNEPELRDLPMKTGANKAFRDGDFPIILFSKSGESYRYMGEFERVFSEPVPIVKNGYYVPGFEIRSKDPDRIIPYIDTYFEERAEQSEWSDNDIRGFCRMYVPGEIPEDDVHSMALSLNKSTRDIHNILAALGGSDSSDVPEELLQRIRDEFSRPIENGVNYVEGFDVDRTVSTRVGQAVFRHNLDDVFGGRCCITGADRREVLVGSHVLPWKLSDSRQKLDPNNGLLLNRFHDSLFDKYLMTVRMDGTIEYLDSLKGELGSIYGRMCEPYDEINFPEGYNPLKEAYAYHNRRFDELAESQGRS